MRGTYQMPSVVLPGPVATAASPVEPKVSSPRWNARWSHSPELERTAALKRAAE